MSNDQGTSKRHKSREASIRLKGAEGARFQLRPLTKNAAVLRSAMAKLPAAELIATESDGATHQDR